MDRSTRQIALPEIGAAGQARLGRSRVLAVGAGGLAAGVLPLLAGAGPCATRALATLPPCPPQKDQP